MNYLFFVTSKLIKNYACSNYLLYLIDTMSTTYFYDFFHISELGQLSGVAAILRYPMPDDDDESDDD